MLKIFKIKNLLAANQAETKESSNSRLKLYLIFVFISVILLFVSIWQAKPIIAEPDDFFGLASHFTLCYWIGLALLLFCSILAFLDNNLKRDYVFIFILIALGLFLYGIGVYGVDNTMNPRDLGTTAEVSNLLATHHIYPTEPHHVFTYLDWPVKHFLSASLMLLPGLDLDFVKYAPLFWMLCFILITYCIGKRLGLAANRCFLLSLLPFSSYWLIQADYSPQGIAYILYLLCFMLIVAPRRSTGESIIAILTFSALVLTHPFTPAVVLLALVALSIYRREVGLLPLFVIILLAWYMYQAIGAFESSVTGLWSNPFTQFFRMAGVERYVAAKPLPALVNRYMQLSYLGIYGVGVVLALVLTILRGSEARRRVMPALCWLVGVVLASLIGYGGELETRLFIFSILPASGIILLSLSSRKLLIGLMVIFVVLSPLTRYGSAVTYGQVPTTELAGAKFLALEVKPETNFFYGYDDGMMSFYDPNLISLPKGVLASLYFGSRNEPNLSVIDNYDYVIISKQTRDRSLWASGIDPYQDWLQTETGKRAHLIYNNGYYQIYTREGK